MGALMVAVRRARAASPALWWVTIAHAGLLVLFLLGLVLDPRLVTGQPVWLKPAKFAASIAAYAVTLAWLLAHVEGRKRAIRWVAGVTAVTVVLEMVVITLQAARGVRSHFNVSTPFDGLLFSLMGVTILVAWGAGIGAAVLLYRQRFEDAAHGWSLRLGLVVSLAGAGLGGLMTQPTDAQVERMRAGEAPGEAGAHAVGASDDAPGLPVTGWSREGGDLRVPHFLGLHAMQLLPLLGVALASARARRRWGVRRRAALVWTASAAYAGTVALLTWQALRGESLVAPGPPVLAVGVGLALATGLPMLVLLRHPRPATVGAQVAA